jgi:hypothetical protein
MLNGYGRSSNISEMRVHPPRRNKKKRVEEPRKKNQSGKQAKHLDALYEVVLDEAAEQATEQQPQAEPEKKKEGMMDKLK